MTETPDRTAVLRRALETIQDRGWAAMWSTDDTSPLNLRSAIANACTQLIGHVNRREWYDAYLDAVHAVSIHLQAGLTDWEAKAKSQVKVEAMLSEVITRLENNDIGPRASRSRPRPTGL